MDVCKEHTMLQVPRLNQCKHLRVVARVDRDSDEGDDVKHSLVHFRVGGDDDNEVGVVRAARGTR